MNTNHQPTRSGFTILEMLAVVFILGLLLGMLFPAINAISRSGRDTAGENAISVAIKAARAYSTRIKPSPDEPEFLGAKFDGVGILFTPAGELRLIENFQRARDTDGRPVDPSGLNAYIDIAGRDYITLPQGVAVAGLWQPGRGSDPPTLVAPPFAIRFDRYGRLVVGSKSSDPKKGRDRLVYYDGNYDGNYLIKSQAGLSRDNPYSAPRVLAGRYDPTDWNPKILRRSLSVDLAAKLFDKDANKYELPFEEIETVIGVIVYSQNDFENALDSDGDPLSWRSSDEEDIAEWIIKNGTPIFFSRYTGAVITE